MIAKSSKYTRCCRSKNVSKDLVLQHSCLTETLDTSLKFSFAFKSPAILVFATLRTQVKQESYFGILKILFRIAAQAELIKKSVINSTNVVLRTERLFEFSFKPRINYLIV